MKDSSIRDSILTIVSIVGLIIVWKIISIIINSDIIFPPPETTFKSLIDIASSKMFWPTIVATIFRGIFALLVSCILGIIFGLIIGVSQAADTFFRPWLIIIMSTPIVSIILVALIWFHANLVPIFVAFLMIFPIIVLNVSEGIKNVDKKLVEMSQSYGVKTSRIISEIYLPSIISYLMAGIISAMGIGWKVVVTAEVLSQPTYAIGTSLQESKLYLETANVFAWTLIAILISFAFEKLIVVSRKLMFRWR